MVTLDTLVDRIPALRFHDQHSAPWARRRHAAAATHDHELFNRGPATGPYASHVVIGCAVAPPWSRTELCKQSVQTLASASAAALVLVTSMRDRLPSRMLSVVAEEAARARIPLLLLSSEGQSPADALRLVQRELESATLLDELHHLRAIVDHLTTAQHPAKNALADLIGSTARAIGGHAAVIATDGRVIGAPASQRILEQSDWPAAAQRVRKGSAGVASLAQAGHFAQFLAIGDRNPRPVLAVARQSPYQPWMSALVRRTASALAISERLAAFQSVEGELQATKPMARRAVLFQLIDGDEQRSRVVAAGLVPDFEDALYLRLHLLECSPEQRGAVLDTLESLAGNQALIVGCPTDARQVIVVVPLRSVSTDDSMGQLVRRVAADHHCRVGSSPATQIGRLREACRMAARSMDGSAHGTAERRTITPPPGLASRLDARAGQWAQEFLRPLDALDQRDRTRLSMTAQYTLRYGQSGAARLLGLNRKTVATRWRRLGDLLGLDISDVQETAVLDLAFEAGTHQTAQTFAGRPPELIDLLRSEPARRWAASLLGLLRHDARPLLRTLRAWVSCSGHVGACAARLQLHTNTVRNHLSACEALLGLRLFGGDSSGVHRIVLALRVVDGS